MRDPAIEPIVEPIMDAVVERLITFAEAGARDRVVALVHDLHDSGMSVEGIVGSIIVPAQIEAGDRWLRNRWSTADEHASTVIMTAALGRLELAAPTGTKPDSTLVVCCPEGEWHAFPAQLIGHLIRRHGWNVVSLGASAPAAAVAEFAASRGAVAVLVSCTLPAVLPTAARLVAEVHRVGLPVVVGGAAFGSDDRRAVAIGADGWAADAAGAERLISALHEEPVVHLEGDPVWPSRIADLEGAVPFLVELVVDHLADRLVDGSTAADGSGAESGPIGPVEVDEAFVEAFDLLLRSVVAASVVDDDRLVEEQVAWCVGFLGHRSVPVTMLVDALDFLDELRIDDVLARFVGVALDSVRTVAAVEGSGDPAVYPVGSLDGPT